MLIYSYSVESAKRDLVVFLMTFFYMYGVCFIINFILLAINFMMMVIQNKTFFTLQATLNSAILILLRACV